ncbi:MAG: hypothetical protein AAGE96_16395 [Cyanobacteria bacterium P01_G01_bin.19]
MRIVQEANASGKARGYADVDTVIWKEEMLVAINYVYSTTIRKSG